VDVLIDILYLCSLAKSKATVIFVNEKSLRTPVVNNVCEYTTFVTFCKSPVPRFIRQCCFMQWLMFIAYFVTFQFLKAGSMKTIALWYMAPCTIHHQVDLMTEAVRLKRRYASTALNGAISHKAAIFCFSCFNYASL
jgi:hypothetical protein